MLSNRAAVNVGVISYPLYLWHWPLLVFAELLKFKRLTDLERGLVIALTFFLAWLTYKFVERPIRFGRIRFAKPLVACMAVLAGAALVPALGYGPSLPDRISKMITVLDPGEGLRVGECMLLDGAKVDFSPNCVDEKHPLMAIWGDSTASTLVPGVRNLHHADFRCCPSATLGRSCGPRGGRRDELFTAVPWSGTGGTAENICSLRVFRILTTADIGFEL